ncbi:hypothetical protein [Roseovarius sp. SYSU LYC5161]|uniref:hypothetical protein n=1 Tax=Roseovarius halophilus (ex Wu et al. 2025) TaxID=3376060 RepID=UPI003999A229
MRRLTPLAVVLLVAALVPPANGRAAEGFRLVAPQALVDSGLLKYVLPRFSLKTGTRIELVAPGAGAAAELTPDDDGTRVFTGPRATWRLRVNAPEHPGVKRFADWLSSEIGQRTIKSFEVDGAAPFSPPRTEAAEAVEVSFDGNPDRGKALSLLHCGRCHVVGDENRMNAIGSTPSFGVLRALRDWQRRFQTFYVLNPHPAFTQVADVTPPFPIDRPSPITPVEMTLGDVEAILAYVAEMTPADLGEPLRHQ